MRTDFRLQISEGIIAFDIQLDVFNSRLLAVLTVDFRNIPAAVLKILQIHAQQHFRPVLRLGPALAGLDAEERISPTIGAIEQRLQFNAREFLLQIGERLIRFFDRLLITRFLPELVHRPDVVDRTEQILQWIDQRLDHFYFRNDDLGRVLVVPESGFTHFRFEFLAASLACGQVKESPESQRSGMRGLRSRQTNSRESWEGGYA